MNIEKYSKIAPQYYIDQIPEILVKLFKNVKPHSVLDCGCGDGQLLYALNKRGLLKGKQVFAIDSSKNRINLVKKNKQQVQDICGKRRKTK